MQPQTVKPSSEILARINKDSLNHKDEVFTRLYRYLFREDVYIAAFQNLYANDGALTPGINDDTANGFGMDYIHDLIDDLRNGTYRPTPVKRVYIPKKNGKFRPLGLPPFRDKLLQEVIHIYLEAIYEPLFDSHSHGFRPNKSCHTALKQIQKEFTGVPWIIEGDIAIIKTTGTFAKSFDLALSLFISDEYLFFLIPIKFTPLLRLSVFSALIGNTAICLPPIFFEFCFQFFVCKYTIYLEYI